MDCCKKVKPKFGIKSIAHGLFGMFKALCGIDKADKNTIGSRLLDCSMCALSIKSKGKITNLSRCIDCGCLIKLKAKVKSESCPQGIWF